MSAPASRVSSSTLSHIASYQMCVCVGEMCAYVCMRPYLKTSGSGPIRSREMVGISGLGRDLRWKRQGGEIAAGR